MPLNLDFSFYRPNIDCKLVSLQINKSSNKIVCNYLTYFPADAFCLSEHGNSKGQKAIWKFILNFPFEMFVMFARDFPTWKTISKCFIKHKGLKLRYNLFYNLLPEQILISELCERI